jgi:dTMP kinase
MPLIVFEGIDGCGKTTQVAFLKAFLEKKLPSDSWMVIREPGGTPLGEEIRSLLLKKDTDCCSEAEFLLYLASRMQLVSSVIKPALVAGKIVVLDRFYYSTIAYQLAGLQLDFMPPGNLEMLIKASAGIEPDIVLYLDIPLDVASNRREVRGKDRIEQRNKDYYNRVLASYQQQAKNNSNFWIIDGTQSLRSVSLRVFDGLYSEKIIPERTTDDFITEYYRDLDHGKTCAGTHQ